MQGWTRRYYKTSDGYLGMRKKGKPKSLLSHFFGITTSLQPMLISMPIVFEVTQMRPFYHIYLFSVPPSTMCTNQYLVHVGLCRSQVRPHYNIYSPPTKMTKNSQYNKYQTSYKGPFKIPQTWTNIKVISKMALKTYRIDIFHMNFYIMMRDF